ncbi:glutamine synthetase [Siminovitchia acidinfaciens]|uniref:glutamine synthetase n=1 Tax=Siminovitchia acidinfaciens TaxID=2321395 RepID=A0A429Y6W2_9BACI|nr:glutamine synthetase family protein [Siminovitchia acidinfaciens]RST77197.1 glutamine synthetase [Siminovitchia acidinfaciens]
MLKVDSSFVGIHNLRSKEEEEMVEQIKATIEEKNIRLIRVAWADQHGISRAKTMTVPAFHRVLESGLEFNTGPLFFDTGSAIVFNPFQEGGGFDLEEMTGCPNYRLIPDPSTFRILPWAPHTAWILTDAYLKDGRPLPFDSRGILRKALNEFKDSGFEYISGIEVEWNLMKIVDNKLNPEFMGAPGIAAEAPAVLSSARGYQYHLESHLDEVDDVLYEISNALSALGLPLSTMEDEWGPSQQEFTFEPLTGLEAADTMLLFRNTVKQICKRHGYVGSFMCRPAFSSFVSSGWHLHQSIRSLETGENVLKDPYELEPTSEIGKHFMGGILMHAQAASVFTTPTINGFKRLNPNSLAPDRAGWGDDNRGTMLRVIGAPGEKNVRFENRIGEPAANPYLYLASQVIAGAHGIQNKIDPGIPSKEAYNDDRQRLPRSLKEAVEALKKDTLYREKMGDLFIDYITKIKESEISRYEAFVKENGIEDHQMVVTDWEQREYFDLF